MGYCTTDELNTVIPSDILVRLTDDASLGEVDEEKLSAAVDEAAGEIDSYLAGRYELPLSTTPAILSKFNKDIAVYNLYGRYKSSIPDTWKNRYDTAVRFLTKVAEGRITLGIQPSPDPAGAGNYESGAKVTVRLTDFDSDAMEKF